MKRKRRDRDIWNFGDSPYYQMRIDTASFQGLVCLLKLKSGNKDIDNGSFQYWDRPKSGKVAICGKGMTWMQLIPDGREHILTVKYLPDNTMSICYVDIIEQIEYDPDGVAVYIDKYLDVDFTPQGDVCIQDHDELDEAFHLGELSNQQYNLALSELESVLKKYCSDISKSVEMFGEIFTLVSEKIANGEHSFRSQIQI